MSLPVAFGVLGVSGIARRAHLMQRDVAPSAAIVAVASRTQAKADHFAHEHALPKAFGSYEALLADETIEAVILTLPNALHAEWAIRAATAGKHVLCEKPLATTRAEAAQIQAAAQRYGVVIMEGFMNNLHSKHTFIREVIASGRIGEIRTVHAELTYTLSNWENDCRVVHALGGGSLFDAGCYCVNGVGRLLGTTPYRAVASQIVRASHGVDETFHGTLHYEGGRTATITSSMCATFVDRCSIIGTQGRMDIDGAFPGGRFDLSTTITVDGKQEKRLFPGEPLHGLQLEHFARCVRREAEPVVSLAESVRNAGIMETLKRAADEGRTLPISSDPAS